MVPTDVTLSKSFYVSNEGVYGIEKKSLFALSAFSNLAIFGESTAEWGPPLTLLVGVSVVLM